MGYHKRSIQRGVLGEFSKITEEFEELLDAQEQGNNILVLCELCDLIGAIELYVSKFNMTLSDLIRMKDATMEAFIDGQRTPAEERAITTERIIMACSELNRRFSELGLSSSGVEREKDTAE